VHCKDGFHPPAAPLPHTQKTVNTLTVACHRHSCGCEQMCDLSATAQAQHPSHTPTHTYSSRTAADCCSKRYTTVQLSTQLFNSLHNLFNSLHNCSTPFTTFHCATGHAWRPLRLQPSGTPAGVSGCVTFRPQQEHKASHTHHNLRHPANAGDGEPPAHPSTE
jgi:hypothetical protein